MGTRAIYGFKKDCKRKYTYCHWDGYPDGLGLKLKQQLKKYDINHMRARYDKFIICEEDDIPETQTINELVNKGYIKKIPKNEPRDWYNVIREWQGDLTPLMEYETPYITYADEYMDHMYRYTIDLDENMFVVDRHGSNVNDYEEILTIPLLELDEMSDDEYIRKCEAAEDM